MNTCKAVECNVERMTAWRWVVLSICWESYGIFNILLRYFPDIFPIFFRYFILLSDIFPIFFRYFHFAFRYFSDIFPIFSICFPDIFPIFFRYSVTLSRYFSDIFPIFGNAFRYFSDIFPIFNFTRVFRVILCNPGLSCLNRRPRFRKQVPWNGLRCGHHISRKT